MLLSASDVWCVPLLWRFSPGGLGAIGLGLGLHSLQHADARLGFNMICTPPSITVSIYADSLPAWNSSHDREITAINRETRRGCFTRLHKVNTCNYRAVNPGVSDTSIPNHKGSTPELHTATSLPLSRSPSSQPRRPLTRAKRRLVNARTRLLPDLCSAVISLPFACKTRLDYGEPGSLLHAGRLENLESWGVQQSYQGKEIGTTHSAPGCMVAEPSLQTCPVVQDCPYLWLPVLPVTQHCPG